MTQESTVTETPEVAAPSFTVQDLATTRSIIEVAASRGAFKAEEMAVVGQTYNKLSAFLAAVAPAAAESNVADEDVAETAETSQEDA